MSKLPFLTLIPAGAGSGKTYRIKEQLADWVEKGLVKPDRIAAVTFTETAASELRGRIRDELMARDKLEEALRLDQSFISTIHSFGTRLLVEYAFEGGYCPAPRLLSKDEEQLLLRKAIARIPRIEPLSRKLHLFGYRYDFQNGLTDVEQFRQRILSAIQILRIIGGDVAHHSRLSHCLEYIKSTYGLTGDANNLTFSLRTSAQLLLDKFPSCMCDVVNSDSAKLAVENDFRNLKMAAQSDALNEDWPLWKKLQGIKVFKSDNQLPANYQEMAREIIHHAEALYQHPGPLKDARRHGEVLLKSAWDALSDYARRKREKGIIDYTDMIDGACLLLEQPQVLKHLADRFDCLVIDEFQDTNPLQFSLLWQLHSAGVPAFIVGDPKQSIMGFQSSDARLMGSLLSQHSDQCSPLNGNWRSQAELMDVINAFGCQLFGNGYTSLESRASYESQLDPLDVICFEGKNITPKVLAQHVAAHVKRLLSDDGISVFDRHLNRSRPIRGEDIAILGQTHQRLKNYADALRDLGVRVRLAQDGWFESRPVQLAYYGLSFVADPQDRHAALYLAVTELGEDDLTSATKTLLQGGELSLPLLKRLKEIAKRQKDLSVEELVAATIDSMDLFDTVSNWIEAKQLRANLLRLIFEAREFMSADTEALAGGGFHGTGLKTFLAWLCNQVESQDGDRQPQSQVHDEEAVQLLTWHSAKGKEWPVVFVTTLDRNVAGRLPSLDIEYTDFSDLDHILDNARLEFSPDFAAPETTKRFKEPLDEKARTEGLNLLYVALTRAREKLVMEWQYNLEESSRYTYWHLLRDAGNVTLNANNLLVGRETFPFQKINADKTPPAVFAEYVNEPSQKLPRIGRRALKSGTLPTDHGLLFMTPSMLHGQQEGRNLNVFKKIVYGSPLNLSLPPGAPRGLLMHRALELIGQGVNQENIRSVLNTNLIDEDWKQIQEMAGSFMQSLQDNFEPLSFHWEVPVISGNRNDNVISGTIDLLIKTSEGYWIFDHKSDEPQDMEASFNHYRPQLKCYVQALTEGMGLKVKGIAIHWTSLGFIFKEDFKG